MSSKKIPVSVRQAPLQTPFAGLDAAGFPDAGMEAAGLSAPEAPQAALSRRGGRVVLRREKARRGGKTVVVISQLPTHLTPVDLENLLGRAKKSLGCGGSLAAHAREIEIQGDQPGRVRTFLEHEGFTSVGP